MGKVKFSRPDKKFHVYLSTEPEGYRVEMVDDNLWAATFEKGPVTNRILKSRAEAFDACSEHADPTPEKLTVKEYTVLKLAVDAGGTVSLKTVISGEAGLSPADALPVFGYLIKRRLAIIDDEAGTLETTDRGQKAVEAYVPRARRARKPQISQYGPRPDWAVKPTKEEVALSQLVHAQAYESMQYVNLRLHPWSKVAQRLHKNAQELTLKAQEAYDACITEDQKVDAPS